MSDYNKSGQMPPTYSAPQAGYSQPMYPSAQYSGQASQTTVIVQQPSMQPGSPGAAPRMWTTGVCDCCDDMGICLCGAFCGLCLMCQVATDIGESGCVPCCVPAADIIMRVKWRTQENIQGSIMDDCFTQWCCGPCGMCQLAREVKKKREGTLYPRA